MKRLNFDDFTIKNYSILLFLCLLLNFLLVFSCFTPFLTLPLLDSYFLALLLFSILLLTKSKPLVFLLSIILSLCALIQYKFFSVFSFGVRLSYLTILKEFFYTKNASFFSLKDLLFFVPCLLVFFLSRPTKKKRLLPITLIVISFLFYLLFPKHSQYHEPYNGIGSNIVSVAQEAISTSLNQPSIDNPEALIKKYSLQETNEFTGLFKGKNLIMILSESLDDFVINELTMPNVYKLKSEGWYFSNFNVPIYPYHTADSEFITNTGMLPSIKLGLTNYIFVNNTFSNSLAHFFPYSEIDHNYFSNYYNRKSMLKSLGYKSSLFAENFTDSSFQIGEGFFSDIDLINNINFSENSPFFNYILTLSMHGAYLSLPESVSEDKIKLIRNELNITDEELVSYYAKSTIFDEAIGLLLEKLASQNLLEDTVIVIFGDHKPFELSNPPEDNIVPLIIYNPEIAGEIIEKPCSIEDVYPTVTNLFGFDTSKYYKAGVDIFSNEPSRLIDPFENKDQELIEFSQWALVENIYK